MEYLNFIPYESIGDYRFGVDLSILFELISTDHRGDIDLSSKYIIQYDDMGYRFDKGKFTQLYVNLEVFIGKISMFNTDLTNEIGIELLIAKEPKIERKAHYIFTEFGLTISKDKKEL
ncbi:hypothetical protein [Flavobacterium cerinum]|uniref:Uncharacterized protein n=1 Tax=Flavobacterium cerinum TaxID=2502784 RepID=A0A444HBA4_9FLAO|nr:hypothetical protein [Flavobacterium cerinum]RWX00593.1 hypothetical protein EPI11_09995 [Flavobacterium cerinum]